MAAEVTKVGINRHQAYCEPCGDGRNGAKASVQKWADEHNNEHHQPTGESK